MLLHGWNATSDLNFFLCYRALGERYRVLAFDQRGHGRGIRTRRLVRLEDCADDVVALADVLGLQRVVPIGYSMGGAVAQLIGRRHPDRVRGLVLCATAGHFNASRDERLSFLGLSGLAMLARARRRPRPAAGSRRRCTCSARRRRGSNGRSTS